jgi:hypothetical protein
VGTVLVPAAPKCGGSLGRRRLTASPAPLIGQPAGCDRDQPAPAFAGPLWSGHCTAVASNASYAAGPPFMSVVSPRVLLARFPQRSTLGSPVEHRLHVHDGRSVQGLQVPHAQP